MMQEVFQPPLVVTSIVKNSFFGPTAHGRGREANFRPNSRNTQLARHWGWGDVMRDAQADVPLA
jgi:hypothetical protein